MSVTYIVSQKQYLSLTVLVISINIVHAPFTTWYTRQFATPQKTQQTKPKYHQHAHSLDKETYNIKTEKV